MSTFRLRRYHLQFIIAFLILCTLFVFLDHAQSSQVHHCFQPQVTVTAAPPVPEIYYNLVPVQSNITVTAENTLPSPIPLRPPTYDRLRQWETNLPQHNFDLPFPEGQTGRYVRFSNQINMLGWNNVLNEV
jgi:hypothetical protein